MRAEAVAKGKKLISIVTPVLNEEDNLDLYFERMNKVLAQLLNYDFEFVFTDNASSDGTFQALEKRAQEDPRIRAFRFSRNFGYQASIYTGYSKAKGDAVIEYDCDLQDPPELLPEFIKKWEEGYQIVYGVRTQRQESAPIQALRKLFYRLLNAISENDLPKDAGDFMLLDRVIVDQLVQSEERNLYLRGMIFSYGFNQVGIPYSRQARSRGASKFPLVKMFSLAVDGIISQSIVPLRVASFAALGITLITIGLAAFYLGLRLFYNYNLPAGFTTTTLLILFSISINAFFLGVIGEYLARIYEAVRKKPLTIIERSTESGS